jgi:hypothetical protein
MMFELPKINVDTSKSRRVRGESAVFSALYKLPESVEANMPWTAKGATGRMATSLFTNDISHDPYGRSDLEEAQQQPPPSKGFTLKKATRMFGAGW